VLRRPVIERHLGGRYTDRRRRQAQGIAAARAKGKYRGRPENTKRNKAITDMLRKCRSWATVVSATGCSRRRGEDRQDRWRIRRGRTRHGT
jgi:DNA invertase Pin-like site-specific DNA recombinase